MTCPVAELLDEFDDADRARIKAVVEDRNHSSAVAASMLRGMVGGGSLTGVDVLKHRALTCPCGDWID